MTEPHLRSQTEICEGYSVNIHKLQPSRIRMRADNVPHWSSAHIVVENPSPSRRGNFRILVYRQPKATGSSWGDKFSRQERGSWCNCRKVYMIWPGFGTGWITRVCQLWLTVLTGRGDRKCPQGQGHNMWYTVNASVCQKQQANKSKVRTKRANAQTFAPTCL